jgi:Secretion system C-terminal sorting domain
LDVSGAIALTDLNCAVSALTSLDVSKNTVLTELACHLDSLTSLDVSKNTVLKYLECYDNALTSLDIRNGNNFNMRGTKSRYGLRAYGNPDLTCIQVDDSAASAGFIKWEKDKTAHYSEDCGYSGVEEFPELHGDVSIFPNPAQNRFTVEFEFAFPQAITIILSDLSGREVHALRRNDVLRVSEEIVVDHLPAGVFLLNIKVGSSSLARKIIVK